MRQFLFVGIVLLAACGQPTEDAMTNGAATVAEGSSNPTSQTAGKVSAPSEVSCLNPDVLVAFGKELTAEAIQAASPKSRIQSTDRPSSFLQPSAASRVQYENTVQTAASDTGNRIECESDIVLTAPFEFTPEALEYLRKGSIEELNNEMVVATDGSDEAKIQNEKFAYLKNSPGWKQAFYDFCTGMYAVNCRYVTAEQNLYENAPDDGYLQSIQLRAKVRYDVARSEQGEIITQSPSSSWFRGTPDSIEQIDLSRFTTKGKLLETKPWCGFRGEYAKQPVQSTYVCLTADQICQAPSDFSDSPIDPNRRCTGQAPATPAVPPDPAEPPN